MHESRDDCEGDVSRSTVLMINLPHMKMEMHLSRIQGRQRRFINISFDLRAYR